MEAKDELCLIVDDEPDICWILNKILIKRGIMSIMALSGHDALELMATNSFRFAFLDAKLPDIDGIELAKQMRKINAAIPVVMVSAYFYKEDVSIEEALSKGLICDFISKPFDHQEILRVIETILP